MKKLLLFVLTVSIMVACSMEEQYVIKGNLEGASGEVVYLQKREAGSFVSIDSAVVVDGPFEFVKGSVSNPSMYYLAVEGKRGTLGFFIENSEITVTGHIDSIYVAGVEGSATQDLFTSYNDGLQPFYDESSELYQQYRAANEEGNEELVEEIMEKREVVFESISNFQAEFVKNNPASFVTPVVLRSISYNLSTDELEAYINELDPAVAEDQMIKDMKIRIEALRKVEIGQKAPDFTQNDVDGNPVTLSEMEGFKFLLIDFWAAWCGPCRAENPHVVAVYNEFHEAGFDVLGVSLDREKDAWLKAIEDDMLPWTQVSDLAYWNNAAAKLYAVNSIPANFLIDAEGTIVATKLRGDALREKVAELLAE